MLDFRYLNLTSGDAVICVGGGGSSMREGGTGVESVRGAGTATAGCGGYRVAGGSEGGGKFLVPERCENGAGKVEERWKKGARGGEGGIQQNGGWEWGVNGGCGC